MFRSSPQPMSLNPCSNGRCSARPVWIVGRYFDTDVLILVLMEDALRDWLTDHYRSAGNYCLNPCSNGRCSASLIMT